MARAPIVGPYGPEPSAFSYQDEYYISKLSKALNWYTYEMDRKTARTYLRHYILTSEGKDAAKTFDRLPDSAFSVTWAYVSKMVENGTVLSQEHMGRLSNHIKYLLSIKQDTPEEVVEEKIKRPSVIENMMEKVNEYIGELEGVMDDVCTKDTNFDLYKDMQAKQLPGAYCQYVTSWIMERAKEFVAVYESTDPDIKEGYSNLGKRKLTSIIKTLSQWKEDSERYEQFKKANRKPRAKKVKSPVQQVSKLKYKKEDTELKLKSVNATELVGASQVWVYNVKYKRLSVYRSDSRDGIQVKGSTLQNYDPDVCEQKTLRKPKEVIDKVLGGGKIQLRKLLSELTTKDTVVNGRINEECILLRAIK